MFIDITKVKKLKLGTTNGIKKSHMAFSVLEGYLCNEQFYNTHTCEVNKESMNFVNAYMHNTSIT
jgi:hypothetical protein